MSFNGSKGSKGLSQQVFLRVSEELAFMNLNYKFYLAFIVKRWMILGALI